jgi:hypothetical protein
MTGEKDTSAGSGTGLTKGRGYGAFDRLRMSGDSKAEMEIAAPSDSAGLIGMARNDSETMPHSEIHSLRSLQNDRYGSFVVLRMTGEKDPSAGSGQD